MDSRMTDEERQAFLAEARVGVLSVAQAGRGPLIVPVWYLYEPGGEVRVWTGTNSHKAKLLRLAGRASFCVQDPNPPYKYVSIEGPVSIEPVQYERDVKALAMRYMGPERSEGYLKTIGGEAGVANDILVCIKPERWLTVDYSKVMPADGD
jgi:PPOX class probable F420-dependent enzyme